MALIDKLGRKPLLIAGLLGVVVSMSMCAYGFKQATYQLTEASVANMSEEIPTQQLQPLVGKVFDNDLDYKNALICTVGRTNV